MPHLPSPVADAVGLVAARLVQQHSAGRPRALLLGIFAVALVVTWTGSLANLLWRRTLVRQGIRPSQRALHRVSRTPTPVSLAAAVAALRLMF